MGIIVKNNNQHEKIIIVDGGKEEWRGEGCFIFALLHFFFLINKIDKIL